ncbi:hypothetical protein SRHO_G00313380, partial [Serrasalmus rhombeus]
TYLIIHSVQVQRKPSEQQPSRAAELQSESSAAAAAVFTSVSSLGVGLSDWFVPLEREGCCSCCLSAKLLARPGQSRGAWGIHLRSPAPPTTHPSISKGCNIKQSTGLAGNDASLKSPGIE